MSGNKLQPTNGAGRRFITVPDRFNESPFHIYFRLDGETGRKDWFYAVDQQIFGPFVSFADADEELSERRAAGRFASILNAHERFHKDLIRGETVGAN